MALTLYHVVWCPDCEEVRQKLADLHVEYEHVVVPELNMGQLLKILRAKYLVPATGLNKIKGQPFKVT